MSTPNQPPKFSRKALLVIFLFALILRLFYLWEIHENPTFDHPTLDARYHDEWAQAIASGKLAQNEAFFRAPLYPYFLGLIYYIFGHNYYAPRIVQYLTGSFGVVLLVLLGVRLFGKKTGLAAGLFYAAYAAMIYFEGELLLDSLLIPLGLFLFLFLYRAKENPIWANWLWAGLWLGLSAITRPNILIFAPVVLFWIWYLFRQRESLLRQAKFAALFLLGTAAPILPVAFHNYQAERPLVLIASQGGINFYIGNNPTADGTTSKMPGRDETHWQLADVREIGRQETGKNLSSADLSGFWYRKGLEFWRRQPAQAAKLLLKKTCLFFTRFEISNNEDIYAAWQGSKLIRLLPVGFWLIGPFGLLGIVFSFVNRRGRLLSLFVLVYSFSMILFFVNARFRLPVLPFLTLCAAYAIFELWQRFREKRTLLPYLAALVAFVFLVNSNFYRLQKQSSAHRYFQLGNVFLEQNNFDEAEGYYRQTLQADPNFRFAHLNLGAIALKRADLKTAEAEFQTELETDPASERAFVNLSLLKRLSEDPRQALFWAEKSIQSKPYFQEGYLNKALAYRELGQPDSAHSALEEGRKKCPRFLLGDFLNASILVEQKKFDAAERELNAVLDTLSRWQPSYDPQPFFVSTRQFGENLSDLKSRAYYLLGRIAGEQKNLPRAIQNFGRSLVENPANTDASADLGTALDLFGRPQEALPHFEKALTTRPGNAVLLYNYGLALAKTGRLAEARDAFIKSLKADSSFLPAREKLALTESLLKKSGQ